MVAKAWEHIASIGRRTFWDPQTVLVVGAGPIGLLGALIAVQHGGEVHVLDRVASGPKPALVNELGATYHTGTVADIGLRPDIVLECTGGCSTLNWPHCSPAGSSHRRNAWL